MPNPYEVQWQGPLDGWAIVDRRTGLNVAEYGVNVERGYTRLAAAAGVCAELNLIETLIDRRLQEVAAP